MGPRDLARAVDVSEQTVRNWEKGETEPYRKNLVSLARALGTSVEYLETGHGQLQVHHATIRTRSDDVTLTVREPGPDYAPIDEEGRLLFDEIDQLMDWLPEGMSRRFVRHVTKRVRLGELYAYGIEQGWPKDRLDRIDEARRRLDALRDAQDPEAGGGGG